MPVTTREAWGELGSAGIDAAFKGAGSPRTLHGNQRQSMSPAVTALRQLRSTTCAGNREDFEMLFRECVLAQEVKQQRPACAEPAPVPGSSSEASTLPRHTGIIQLS